MDWVDSGNTRRSGNFISTFVQIFDNCVSIMCISSHVDATIQDDVIKWEHFPRYWPFVRWIPLTKASDAELWCFFFDLRMKNGWENDRGAGNLKRHNVHYDVTVICDYKQFYCVVWIHRSFTFKKNDTWYLLENIYTKYTYKKSNKFVWLLVRAGLFFNWVYFVLKCKVSNRCVYFICNRNSQC